MSEAESIKQILDRVVETVAQGEAAVKSLANSAERVLLSVRPVVALIREMEMEELKVRAEIITELRNAGVPAKVLLRFAPEHSSDATMLKIATMVYNMAVTTYYDQTRVDPVE